MQEYTFEEPASIKEAESRIAEAREAIRSIEHQFRSKNRYLRSDGRRMNPKEYRKWRSGAHVSLNHFLSEVGYLKRWVKDRRRALDSQKLGIYTPDSPDEMLRRCHLFLREVLDGKDLDAAGAGALMHIIDSYLKHVA